VDLVLYARVLWRFRFLVIGGFLLAVILAVLSLAKVSLSHGLTYRKPLVYQSSANVLLTRRGFPWGSLSGAAGAGSLTGLAAFYAQLVSSDAVTQRLDLPRGETGTVSAKPLESVTSAGTDVFVPVVQLEGFATSAAAAVDVTNRAARALIGYVSQQQQAAAIPNGDRVVLQVMDPATGAVVVAKRKKTLPIMIFVLVMTATVGLAFILENVRPAAPVTPDRLQDADAAGRRRRVGPLTDESPTAETA